VELHDLYSSPSIIRIFKSWRMGWADHVARMGEKRTLIDHWWDGMGWDGMMWTGLVWLRIGTGGELL
jgi:hypothetical protein